MKTAVIIGAGKGMGNSLARVFARHGFRVVLIARRQSAIDQYVADLKSEGLDVIGLSADASDQDSLSQALSHVMSCLGHIDALIYNAAYMSGGKLSEMSPQILLDHYKTDILGAQTAVSSVLPEMKKQSNGAILFTGGLFGVFPNANPDYACISMNKSALRVMAQMLNSELNGSGVFCGIVNIMGIVGGSPAFAPDNIAEAYWNLYNDRDHFEVNYQ